MRNIYDNSEFFAAYAEMGRSKDGLKAAGEWHANLKYKYGNRHFWCRGYYVDTVGKNAKKIQEYIQNQLKEDLEYDQMTLKEYIDPFTGEPVKQSK